MDRFLRIFIKDYEGVLDENIRKKCGTLSSIMGIAANILLFALKFLMGAVSGSVSILSDAFNNLSDAGSCVLTFFGYKLAAKPADKDHPFGHGRMEYIFSLVVASVIMVLGVELFKSSVTKIFEPESIRFSWVVVGALVVSMLVKLWLSYFNRTLGKKINSSIMIATGKDSAVDVLATLSTLVSLFASLFTGFPIDGIMGCIVSIIIIYAGVGIVKDTVDELIGKPADSELVVDIKKIMLEEDAVLGVHDVIIHSYGPGVTFGSIHAEVSAASNILEIHDVIDELEKKVYDVKGVVLTVHMDPIQVGNAEVDALRMKIEDILKDIDSALTFHDFRVVFGNTHTNLIFDIVVPFDSKKNKSEIKSLIDAALEKEERNYFAVINFDNEY